MSQAGFRQANLIRLREELRDVNRHNVKDSTVQGRYPSAYDERTIRTR
jgi:hypothetical protein